MPNRVTTKPEELEFKISIYLKDLIGRELVTNKQVAVLELVKNSYDAYSRKARIIFSDQKDGESLPPRIIVVDNGKGMSRDDIKNKWMFVGYSEKRGGIAPPEQQKFGRLKRRTMAGTKGIGRFSCDKLGRFLDMYTRASPGPWGHLRVDWGQFEVQDQSIEFQTVRPIVDARDPPAWLKVPAEETGTILDISGLREIWDFDDIFKLKRWLERLTDPFNPEDFRFRIYIEAPMFRGEESKPERRRDKERVNGLVENQLPRKLAQTTTMATCSLTGGKAATSLTDKGKLLYRVVDDVSDTKFLKEVDSQIDVYYLSKAAKSTFTKTMGIEPVKYGSIMLYRNNFRVMPFGEPGDDWLGLERRKGQGTRRFLASRELIGRISVADDEGLFEEVSSRAGGIKNEEALQELRTFVRDKLVRRLERYVVDVIRWDSPDILVTAEKKGVKLLDVVTSLAGGREGVLNIIPGSEAFATIRQAGLANAETIIENLKALSGTAVSGEAGQFLEQNVSALRSVVLQAKRELAAKEEQVLFLEKSEARKGELVAMMQHAFSIVNDSAVPAIRAVASEANARRLPKSFLQKVAEVNEAVHKLMVLSQLASTAKFDLGKEQVEADLVSYTVQYLKSHWAETLSLRGITLNIAGENVSHKRKTDVLAFSLVIDNLVDNARKAGAKNIYVRFEIQKGQLSVMFSDDGAGVSRGAVAKLFAPGFSTTSGTGLGLYSVKRIMEEIGGGVEFSGNGVVGLGKGACFKVTL